MKKNIFSWHIFRTGHFFARFFPFLIGLLLSLIWPVTAQKMGTKQVSSTLKQGICGAVLVKKGNNMPSPDRPASTGQPVEREVLIFPLLNISQVDAGENGFINSVGDVKPVKMAKSGKDGKFCVSLPPGRYSVVVREPQGLYANLFDSQNNISPVTIQKGKKVTIRVEITHEAVF